MAIVGGALTLIDQIGRYMTVQPMLSTVSTYFHGFEVQQMLGCLVDRSWNAISDGRLILLVGFGLMLWAVTRPDALQESTAVPEPKDDSAEDRSPPPDQSSDIAPSTMRPESYVDFTWKMPTCDAFRIVNRFPAELEKVNVVIRNMQWTYMDGPVHPRGVSVRDFPSNVPRYGSASNLGITEHADFAFVDAVKPDQIRTAVRSRATKAAVIIDKQGEWTITAAVKWHLNGVEYQREQVFRFQWIPGTPPRALS